MGKGSAELFASATLMRPWRKPKSKEEQQRDAERAESGGQVDYSKQKEMIKVRTSLAQEACSKHMWPDIYLLRLFASSIQNFLQNVELIPKELIFVGRSMRIVQGQ